MSTVENRFLQDRKNDFKWLVFRTDRRKTKWFYRNTEKKMIMFYFVITYFMDNKNK